MILRCTGKMLSLLDPSMRRSVISVSPYENDWYANLLWFDRRKCMLLTHAGSLFSAFAADVRAADVRPIGRFAVSLVQQQLRAEELPADTFGLLDPEDVLIAKTADRSVLGCMNDMALACECFVADSGGLLQSDITALNRMLRRHINSARGYVPPIELVRDGRRFS